MPASEPNCSKRPKTTIKTPPNRPKFSSASSGQLNKYFDELVLINQIFWKDGESRVGDLVKETIAKLGENIVVRQFKRIELGVAD